MTKRHTPDGRKSKLVVVSENPVGPHQAARCCGVVQTSKTNSRGASITRAMTMERAISSALFSAATLFLPGLQRLHIVLEPVEALFPQAAVALQPVVDILEGFRLDAAWAPLRLPSAADESCLFQNFQML